MAENHKLKVIILKHSDDDGQVPLHAVALQAASFQTGSTQYGFKAKDIVSLTGNVRKNKFQPCEEPTKDEALKIRRRVSYGLNNFEKGKLVRARSEVTQC